MLTMSQINHIKDLSNCGYRISEISKKTGVRGKVILQPHGKEFFTWYSKHLFTLHGKHFFT